MRFLRAVAAVALSPALGADAKEAKKIGLAVANLQANFFNQIKESVEADGKEKGVKVITVDAKGDAATQVNQIQDLLAQNIDALIYIPGRRDRGGGAGQGRATPRESRSSTSTATPTARRATRSSPPTASLRRSRSATTSPSRPAARARCSSSTARRARRPKSTASKGCGEALKDYPDIKVVGELWSEGWHQDEGFKLTQDLLQAHPKVSIIFGQADALALGAAQAVKVAQSRSSSIWVAGFDGDTAALTALKDGVFDVTATQQTQKMGRMGVDAAIDLVGGQEAAGRAASGRDADDEGQCRRLHRQAHPLIAIGERNGRRRSQRRPEPYLEALIDHDQ